MSTAHIDIVPTTIPEILPDLVSLAIDINREHAEVLRCAAQGAEHAKRAGEMLQQVKAALPHGAWLPWLAEHCEVSPRMAQRYMRIAAGWSTLESKTTRVSHLPTRRALALLETPTPATEPTASRLNTVAINEPAPLVNALTESWVFILDCLQDVEERLRSTLPALGDDEHRRHLLGCVRGIVENLEREMRPDSLTVRELLDRRARQADAARRAE